MNHHRSLICLKISVLAFVLFFGSDVQAAVGYAFAASSQTATVLANNFVHFNLSSAPHSADITPPVPNGNTFTVNVRGTYLFIFHVRGTPAHLTPPDPLVFELTANGVAIARSRFQSDIQTTSLAAGGTLAVNGHVIKKLDAGTKIRLHNVTQHAGTPANVTLTSAPTGGPATDNAALTILRIA